ncbi:MAG: ATP-binding cassette domain-containing protein [Desulfobacterales bacterium]
MALIGMRDVCWGFGDPPLLENITFQIEKGERVCLLGRNGVGKSTLLKLFAREILPDRGDVWRHNGVSVAAMLQDVPPGCDGTVFDVIAQGFGETGGALVEYNRICKTPETSDHPTGHANRRDELQRMLDTEDGWGVSRRIDNVLSRVGLDPEQKFIDLSAGMKRLTQFAGAFALEPDILLLDEPSNHLDIDTIIWLETFVLRHAKTLLFITHDRAFLKRVATRVVELDRGRLLSYDCDYQTYLKRSQAALEAEEKQNRVFDKKLSQEENWIRQGIKARRTRNEGRVRVLKKMREAYRARRSKINTVRLQVQAVERSGRLVMETTGITYSHGRHPVVRDFSTTVMRGDKVGIIGPNGAGKTTLLRILLKEITPDKGDVRHGTRFEPAYFDQLRVQLDEHRTVQENIGEGNDFIIFNGQKRHIISYLQDFLFAPERCRTPVYVLSGGEKNRLMLAKLFTAPANVLVLDEPTNDLDAETLELLEELLVDYKGTLLLVSHDRTFLNNVVTSTLAFEGDGRIVEYAGGYDDWLVQRSEAEVPPPEKKAGRKNSQRPKPAKKSKLGFMEKRELKDLPQKIDALESEQQELYETLSDPLFYKKTKEAIRKVKTRLNEVDHGIDAAYRRWEALESIANIEDQV